MPLAISGILITGTHSISDWGTLRKFTEMSSGIAAMKIHGRLARNRDGFFSPETSLSYNQCGKKLL